MKYLKILPLMVLSATLFFTACKKDDGNGNNSQTQLNDAKANIVGKWMAKSETDKEYDASGNVTDEYEDTYDTNEMITEFTSNNVMSITWDDGSTYTVKYQLKEQTTKYGVTGYYLSVYENNSTEETYFALISISGKSMVAHQFYTDVDNNNKEYLAEYSSIIFEKQ